MCAKLGSDLNVCLKGGCTLATSRGEITEKISCINSPVTLIKPKHLGISAGEAYKKYALKDLKPQNNMTEKMLKAIKNNADIKPYLLVFLPWFLIIFALYGCKFISKKTTKECLFFYIPLPTPHIPVELMSNPRCLVFECCLKTLK